MKVDPIVSSNATQLARTLQDSTDNGFWSNYSRSDIGMNFTYTNNLGWFYAEGGTT